MSGESNERQASARSEELGMIMAKKMTSQIMNGGLSPLPIMKKSMLHMGLGKMAPCRYPRLCGYAWVLFGVVRQVASG